MSKLEQIYEQKCNNPSDINELLPILRKYAEKCDHITEMGVRWVTSTYALMSAKPKKLISYDIESPEKYGTKIQDLVNLGDENGVEFEFKLESTVECEIEETDFLFIDTWHVYDQLKQELKLHANKVRKYIAFHDTTTFGMTGEGSDVGLWPAIEEFLNENKNWVICEKVDFNNGLTVLERQ